MDMSEYYLEIMYPVHELQQIPSHHKHFEQFSQKTPKFELNNNIYIFIQNQALDTPPIDSPESTFNQPHCSFCSSNFD